MSVDPVVLGGTYVFDHVMYVTGEVSTSSAVVLFQYSSGVIFCIYIYIYIYIRTQVIGWCNALPLEVQNAEVFTLSAVLRVHHTHNITNHKMYFNF